jgi:hypothetical protein
MGVPVKREEISVRRGVSGVTVFHTLRDYCTGGLEDTLKFKRTKAASPILVTGEVETRIIAPTGNRRRASAGGRRGSWRGGSRN